MDGATSFGGHPEVILVGKHFIQIHQILNQESNPKPCYPGKQSSLALPELGVALSQPYPTQEPY